MSGIDIFGSLKGSTSLGTRLNNMKTSLCPNAQQILTVNLDDTVGVQQVSNYGLGLLNTADASTLLNTLINTDSSITISDLGTGQIGQIDVKIDNTLIQQWKVLYTKVLNELQTLSIIPSNTTCDIGSVASPYRSIYASNIYQPSGSNQLSFYTNALERLRINSAGNIGLGGASTLPNMLQVNGNIGINSKAEAGQAKLFFYNNPFIDGDSASNSAKTAIIAEGINSFTKSKLHFCNSDVGNVTSSAGISDARMTILSNGNVGVGTTSPSDKLDVVGSIKVAGNIYPEATNTRDIGTTGLTFNGVYCNGLIQPSASNAMTFNCNSAERLRITSAGNVGIGTNNPFSLFDVSSSSINPIMTLATTTYTNNPASATTVATLRMHNDKPQNDKFCEIKAVVRQGNHTPSIVFSTKNSWVDGVTDRMIITENGGVGINTITPTSTLDVRGVTSIKTSATGAGSLKVMVGTGLANDNTWIGFGGGDGTPIDTNDRARIGCQIPGGGSGEIFFTAGTNGGTEIMRIKALGVGVGTSTLTSGSILTVNGNTTCIGNILPDLTASLRSLGSSTKLFDTLYCTSLGSASKPITNLYVTNVGSEDDPLTNVYATNFGSSATPADNIYGNVWQTNTGSNLRCGNNLILMGLETLATPPWYDLSCGSTIQMDTVNLTTGSKQRYDDVTKEMVISTGITMPAITIGQMTMPAYVVQEERIRIGELSLKTKVSIIPTSVNATLGDTSNIFKGLYAKEIFNPLPSTPLILGASTAQLMWITTTNVRIGENSGTEKLSVKGNIYQSGHLIPNHNLSTIGTSNSDRFLSGYFGTVYANGVALTSDRRLKDNIKPITNGLSTVMKMKPVEYNMKGRVRLHTGFLADEMENLYNGEDWACFVKDKDEAKTQSLQYTEVVAILVKAIQEMNESKSRDSTPSAVNFESKMVDKYPEENNQRFDTITLKMEELVNKNDELTSKIADLETKNIDLSNELDIVKTRQISPIVVKEAKIEIEDSDNGSITMIESLQERIYKSEALISKQATMIKKLTVAVNKLLKGSE
jgi:hypothetical protein